MVFKTILLMDYIHCPVSSIDHDVSKTGCLRNVVIYRRNWTIDVVHKQVSLVLLLVFVRSDKSNVIKHMIQV
jgi:hypothetical protein